MLVERRADCCFFGNLRARLFEASSFGLENGERLTAAVFLARAVCNGKRGLWRRKISVLLIARIV